MRIVIAALACSLLAAVPAGAVPRLVNQHVVGWKRICSYEDSNRSFRAPSARRTYSLEVGRGEPCPHRYSPPEPPRPPEQAEGPAPR